jgi:hypothetical protein
MIFVDENHNGLQDGIEDPAQGQRLTLIDRDSVKHETTSDREGRFRLGGVPRGGFSIRVNDDLGIPGSTQFLWTEVKIPMQPTLVTTPTVQPEPTQISTMTPLPTSTVVETPTPELPYFITPRDREDFDCEAGSNCLIPVEVQWAPPSPADRRRLYLLVQPRPGEGFPYYPQPIPSHQGDGVYRAEGVGLGFDDPAGTAYWICIFITSEEMSTLAPISQSDLPSDFTPVCISVSR